MQDITYKNILGALVRPGGNAIRNGQESGDSLLIDFNNNFFAVADSPERNPSASRSFLEKMQVMVSTLELYGAGREFISKDIDATVERIVNNTNSVIKSIRYNDNTTFTGIFIIRCEEMSKGLLLHSGDSLLYHLRIEELKAEKVSQTNHCFVGRNNELYQAQLFDFYFDSRFLLVTDGFYDLVRPLRYSKNKNMENELIELLRENDIDQIPSILLKTYDSRPDISDDFGIIAVNPAKVFPHEATTVIF